MNDVSSPESSIHGRVAALSPLILVLLIAAVWIYRTPYSASNLEVTPDSVEYALAPLELLETGHYQIILEGRPLPPRYPPWFSTVVILPAYLLFGRDPGNAILPVTAMAVAGVGLAWAIGKRMSGPAGGIIAALAILFLPTYGNWATQVMSDVPATTLMLAVWLLYLRLREGATSVTMYLGAGVLIAFDALCRPVFAAMLLPFLLEILRTRQRMLRNGVAFLLPMAGAGLATVAYNSAVFGSAFRNGYNFWVAIPMDYPALVFSLSYFKENLSVVLGSVFPIYLLVSFVAWIAVRKREPAALGAARSVFWEAWTFVRLTTLPILLFHLIYFFPSDRFYLPMFTGVAIIAGAMCGLLFRPRTTSLLTWLPPLVLVLAIGAKLALPATIPHRRLAADRIRAHTQANALIIAAVEPVYLERLAAHGSSRRIVPISRNVEYASKLLVSKRVDIPNAAGLDWRNHRFPQLLLGGAKQAVNFVASEQLDALVAEAAAGTPVFLETTYLGNEADVLNHLQERFIFLQRAPFLYELRLR